MSSVIKMLAGFHLAGIAGLSLFLAALAYMLAVRLLFHKKINYPDWLRIALVFFLFFVFWRFGAVLTTSRYWVFGCIFMTVIGCSVFLFPLAATCRQDRLRKGALIGILVMIAMAQTIYMFAKPQKMAGIVKSVELVKEAISDAKLPVIISASKEAARLRFYGNWSDETIFQKVPPSLIARELPKYLRKNDLIVICARRGVWQQMDTEKVIDEVLKQHGFNMTDISRQSVSLLPDNEMVIIALKNDRSEFFGSESAFAPANHDAVKISEDFNCNNIAVAVKTQNDAGSCEVILPQSFFLRVPEKGVKNIDEVNIRLQKDPSSQYYLELKSGVCGIQLRDWIPARKYGIEILFGGDPGSELLLTVYPDQKAKNRSPKTFHLGTAMTPGQYRYRKVLLPDFSGNGEKVCFVFYPKGKINLKYFVLSVDSSIVVSPNIEKK